MLFCVFLELYPFKKVVHCCLCGFKSHSFLWGFIFIHHPCTGIEFIEIASPVTIKPSGAIYRIKMVFMQSSYTGISQPVNLCAIIVRGLNEPRKGFFIYGTRDFLCNYSTDSDIRILLAHLDKIVFAPADMPYWYGFLYPLISPV